MRQIRRCRSDGVVRDHGPSSNARRAAATARSSSAAAPCATSVIFSPVAGSKVGNVRPDAAFTHCPPISSCLVPDTNSRTAGRTACSATAVTPTSSSWTWR